MLFLTSRAKTSISEEGIELCWTPGAIHSAKMTYPLYGDGTCVKVGYFSFQVDGECFYEAMLLEFFSLLYGYGDYNLLLNVSILLFTSFSSRSRF